MLHSSNKDHLQMTTPDRLMLYALCLYVGCLGLRVIRQGDEYESRLERQDRYVYWLHEQSSKRMDSNDEFEFTRFTKLSERVRTLESRPSCKCQQGNPYGWKFDPMPFTYTNGMPWGGITNFVFPMNGYWFQTNGLILTTDCGVEK
jgi:hypothetical protein